MRTEQRNRAIGILVFLLCPIWLGVADEETLRRVILHQQVAELNRLRATAGVPPLKLNLKLCEAAEYQTDEMRRMERLTHQDRQGRGLAERVKMVNYPYRALGEIVAVAPRWNDALHSWLHSPEHREIMLSPSFHEVGVSLPKRTSGQSPQYWTAVFGRREGVYPIVIENDSPMVYTSTVSLYVYGAEQATKMRLSNDGITWTEVNPPRSRLKWQLRPRLGMHTVWVDLEIKGKRYRSQDEVQLVIPKR